MGPLEKITIQSQIYPCNTESAFNISLKKFEEEINKSTSLPNIILVKELLKSLLDIKNHRFYEALQGLHSILCQLALFNNWSEKFCDGYLNSVKVNAILCSIEYLEDINITNDDIELIVIHLFLLNDQDHYSQPPTKTILNGVNSNNSEVELYVDYTKIAHETMKIIKKSHLTPVTSMLQVYLFYIQITATNSINKIDLKDLTDRIDFWDLEIEKCSNLSIAANEDTSQLIKPEFSLIGLFLAAAGCCGILIQAHRLMESSSGDNKVDRDKERMLVWKWCERCMKYINNYVKQKSGHNFESVDFLPDTEAEVNINKYLCLLSYQVLPSLDVEYLKKTDFKSIDSKLIQHGIDSGFRELIKIKRAMCFLTLSAKLTGIKPGKTKETEEQIQQILNSYYLLQISFENLKDILGYKIDEQNKHHEFVSQNCLEIHDQIIKLKMGWLFFGYYLLGLLGSTEKEFEHEDSKRDHFSGRRLSYDDTKRILQNLLDIEKSFINAGLDSKWGQAVSVYTDYQSRWMKRLNPEKVQILISSFEGEANSEFQSMATSGSVNKAIQKKISPQLNEQFFTELAGGVYSGKMVDGECHGSGVYVFPDGKTVYEGMFHHGDFHGDGKLTETDGNIYKVVFDKGVLKKKIKITQAKAAARSTPSLEKMFLSHVRNTKPDTPQAVSKSLAAPKASAIHKKDSKTLSQSESKPAPETKPLTEEEIMKQLVAEKLGGLVFPAYDLNLPKKVLHISSANQEKMKSLKSLFVKYVPIHHFKLINIKFGKTSSFDVTWNKTTEIQELFRNGAFCREIELLAPQPPNSKACAATKSSDQTQPTDKSAPLPPPSKADIDWQTWREQLELLACGAKVRHEGEGYLVIDYEPSYDKTTNAYTLSVKPEKEKWAKQTVKPKADLALNPDEIKSRPGHEDNGLNFTSNVLEPPQQIKVVPTVKFKADLDLIRDEIISRLGHEDKGLNFKSIVFKPPHQFKVIPTDPIPDAIKFWDLQSNIQGYLASKLPPSNSKETSDAPPADKEPSQGREGLPALLPSSPVKPAEPPPENSIGRAQKILDDLKSLSKKDWRWLEVKPKEVLNENSGVKEKKWIFFFKPSAVKTISIDDRHISTKEYLLTFINSVNLFCRREVIFSKDYRKSSQEWFQFSIMEDSIQLLEDPALVIAVAKEINQWVETHHPGVMVAFAGEEHVHSRESAEGAAPASQAKAGLPPLPKAVSGLLPTPLLHSASKLLRFAEIENLASKDLQLLREWHYHLLVCVHNIKELISVNKGSWKNLRLIFRHHNLSLNWEEDLLAIRTITHYVLHFLSPGPQKRIFSVLEKDIGSFLEKSEGGLDEERDLTGLESRIAGEKAKLVDFVRGGASKEAILMTASIIGALFNLDKALKLKEVDELCQDICRDVGHDPNIDQKWNKTYRDLLGDYMG